jgi:hypothetical protein
MNNIIILLSSSTSAARLKNSIINAGFEASVIGTPTLLSRGGCNYSVLTTASALKYAEETLARLEIKYRGIYLDTGIHGSSRYRELSPGGRKNDIS